MADLRWWRLEVDAKGKVVSCTPVEFAEKDGKSWFYVRARNQEGAGRLAMNAYILARQRIRLKRLKAEGKCVCGRKNDRPGKTNCTICVAKERDYDARRRARERGEEIPRPDRRIADAERRATEDGEFVERAAPTVRLNTLLEVQQAWQDSNTNANFTRWLLDQIAAAGGVKRAG
ncbi:MAG TPA: hypothetical protein VJN18_32355 [Polyangiaceae bacterium]|nr:hypothetical protein [Polyangiaceae bacterium]